MRIWSARRRSGRGPWRCRRGLRRGAPSGRCAGLLAAAVDVEALLDLAALLGDLRFDAVDVVADIHAIGDGALVVVFRDEVLVEEADGLLARAWR